MLDTTKIELPYSFDLCYDMKRLSELQDKLAEFAELLCLIEAEGEFFNNHPLNYNFVRIETKDLSNV